MNEVSFRRVFQPARKFRPVCSTVIAAVVFGFTISTRAQMLVAALPGDNDAAIPLKIGEKAGPPNMDTFSIVLRVPGEAEVDPLEAARLDGVGFERDLWLGKNRVVVSGHPGWRYLDSKEGAPKGWEKPNFDASKWKKGDAPLGYGEPSVKTTLAYGPDADNKYVCAFFRLDFDLKRKSETDTWVMRALVDDGAVFYLNGKEVQRVRMAEGEITNETRPNVKTGSSSGLEGKYVHFKIKPEVVKEGKNVLCARVHQFDADSSDLVLDVEMIRLSEGELASIEKEEKKRKEEEERLAAAKALEQQQQIVQIAQPATLVTIFESRARPERVRMKHMLQSLPQVIGITEDQVAELILAADEAYTSTKAMIEQRSQTADQPEQNRLRNDIYQNKFSLTKDEGLRETFAAILTLEQLRAYSEFVAQREEQRLASTIDMFYSNLNCGLFFTEEQKPKMLKMLREVALDPVNARSYSSSNSPVNLYYQIQNGFTRAARAKDERLKEILNAEQLKTLEEGISTGAIYGGGFINVDDVLTPEEQ